MKKVDCATQFQSAVTALRKKKRDVVDSYHVAMRNLMRSFDIMPKDKIIENVINEHRLDQEQMCLIHAIKLCSTISEQWKLFVQKPRPQEIDEVYCELCGLKQVMKVDKMSKFIEDYPPEGEVTIVAYPELNDKDIVRYVHKFAEEKGSTQGAASRLLELFPPPKTKPQIYGSTRRTEEE